MTADTGRSALAVLREEVNAPDLLITDVNMPLMDGIELSQRIRERYPRCRIMIISGYEDFQAARSAIELGALRYMLKPINHAEMVAYVRSGPEDVVREQDERSATPPTGWRACWWTCTTTCFWTHPTGVRSASPRKRETTARCAWQVEGLPGGEGVPPCARR